MNTFIVLLGLLSGVVGLYSCGINDYQTGLMCFILSAIGLVGGHIGSSIQELTKTIKESSRPRE